MALLAAQQPLLAHSPSGMKAEREHEELHRPKLHCHVSPHLLHVARECIALSLSSLAQVHELQSDRYCSGSRINALLVGQQPLLIQSFRCEGRAGARGAEPPQAPLSPHLLHVACECTLENYEPRNEARY